jgi:poly(3-hydroxybutyrate) depolymerase
MLELVSHSRPATGSGEPSLIAGITRQIMCDYSIDPKRVDVGGVVRSGRGCMGPTYNDLCAAIGVRSGLACEAVTDAIVVKPRPAMFWKNGASSSWPQCGSAKLGPRNRNAVQQSANQMILRTKLAPDSL